MPRSVHFGLIWVVALAINAGFAFLLFNQVPARPDRDAVVSFAGVDTVFLGSSLTLNAIPTQENAPDWFMEETSSYLRIGLSNAKAEELEELLDEALDNGVSTIFLEARPVLYQTKAEYEDERCLPIRCQSREVVEEAFAPVGSLRERFRDMYRSQFGLSPVADRYSAAQREPRNLDVVYAPRRPLGASYPLHLLADRDNTRLVELSMRARSQGSRIVLFMPPRSPTANAYIPASQHIQVEARLQSLAQTLDVPVVDPIEGWRDDHFVDHAHLNRFGRDRFLRAFSDWVAVTR